ncbi:MAG: class I SAM-dependent methyltransferase [Mucilaginibacter sp.]
MAANYNNAAWFYDRLSRLVYGNVLVDAQVYLLQYVPPNSKLLIVGGGTGWILDELSRIHPSGLKITYVEISEKMANLSRQRNVGNNEVIFINDAIENVALRGDFDAIITPFLFDNFTKDTLNKVFTHIKHLAKPNGLWLNTDFQLTGKWWQNVLLRTMFVFFKICCGIEASRLPDIDHLFIESNYTAIAQKTFFGDFITSKAFRKF